MKNLLMSKIFVATLGASVITGGIAVATFKNIEVQNLKDVKHVESANDNEVSNLDLSVVPEENMETKEEVVLENETTKKEQNVVEKDSNDSTKTVKTDDKKTTEEPKEEIVESEVEEQKEQVVPSESQEENKKEEQLVVPEVKEPEKETPKIETTTPDKDNEEKQEESKSEEETPAPKEEVITPTVKEDYKNVVEDVVKKTADANSARYILTHTGYYTTKDDVWYNKNDNRRYGIFDDKVKEYVEGIPGRQNLDSPLSSYYYQDIWLNKNGVWEKQPSLYSGFGISTLSLLKNIKTAVLHSDRPWMTYLVTIDKDVANKAMENLYNRVNTFKNDIKVYVSVDKRTGYIIHVGSNWKNEDFTDSKTSFTFSLVIADVNNTKVNRPEELKNVVITDNKKPDELTATKKQEYARLIENAYAKTRDANSLTYSLNGKTMAYNKANNEALLTDGNTITYYKGTAGMYMDYDFVAPKYHQDSWTKTNGTWVKNVRKHTTFTPQELLFLNHIFTINKVEKKDDITTYTAVILPYDANLAYSEVYGIKNKFSENFEFQVSVDDQGFIRSLNMDFGSSKLDLTIDKINTTEIVKPDGIA